MNRYESFNDLCGNMVISAKDLLSSLSDIETDYEILVEGYEDARRNMTEDEFQKSEYHLYDNGDDYAMDKIDDWEFLEALRLVQDDLEMCQQTDDILILKEHFEDYVQNIIDDCYEIPNSGSWPYNHIVIDYAGAAQEVESDYRDIEIGGYTYLTLA